MKLTRHVEIFRVSEDDTKHDIQASVQLLVRATGSGRKHMYLQSGKRHSGAPMFAPSETHVRRRIRPAHDKFIRVIENFRITIGSCVAQCDRLSWFDRFSMEMNVLGSGTSEPSIWAIQSKEFFHSRRDQ